MSYSDIIGGDVGTGAAPSVGAVYTDPSTVKRVQRALRIKEDGALGPVTRAAILKFNTDRGFPGDGSNITDGALAAVASAEYAQKRVTGLDFKPPTQDSVPTLTPTPSAPESTGFFDRNVEGINRPVWQVALGAVGVFALGFGVYLSLGPVSRRRVMR